METTRIETHLPSEELNFYKATSILNDHSTTKPALITKDEYKTYGFFVAQL